MFDPRIYRAGFIPVIAAIVVLMFSLERAPDPLEQPISTPPFPAQESSQLAGVLARDEPVRTPGSAGDLASAEAVRDSFAEIDGGELADQTFETSFEGTTVETRNVILTLPGQRPDTILIVAPRDTLRSSPGATTSAASTATLLTLAELLGSSPHERTIVLASISATDDGSAGVRQLAEALNLEDTLEAAITIEGPGVRDRQQPFVFGGRAGSKLPPAVLLSTAEAIATLQFGEEAAPTDAWNSLVRLALPFGIGPSAALADQGLDAVTISGAGERPPSGEGTIWRRTMSMAGSSTLDLVLTIDESDASVAGGPGEYIVVGDNLLPAWTLSLLALTLILPALLAAGDLWLHDRRRDPRKARRAIPWVLERGLPPLAALILAYLLGFAGLIPDPALPYDPGEFPPDTEGAIASIVLLLAVVIGAVVIRPLRTPLDSEPQTLAAAAGLVTSVALLGIWLLQPFVVLLLTPAAHVWVVAARPQGPPRAGLVAALALLSLLPLAAATVELASSLELGASVVWQLLVMVVSGQIGPLVALLWCPLLGALAACVAAAAAGRGTEPAPRPRPQLRGPSGYAGPGSLGGTPSTPDRRGRGRSGRMP